MRLLISGQHVNALIECSFCDNIVCIGSDKLPVGARVFLKGFLKDTLQSDGTYLMNDDLSGGMFVNCGKGDNMHPCTVLYGDVVLRPLGTQRTRPWERLFFWRKTNEI